MMSLGSTLVRWEKEHAPSSLSLKVPNITKLQKSTESLIACFESCGYNWRLIVYPNGYENEGYGYISMYVQIDNACLMASFPYEVYADLTFSVYNKKQNKYFAFKDLEPKWFNTLRTSWGFARTIDLHTFNDPESGYIFGQDECEFGVDVIVVQPPTVATMSFDDRLPTIPKFCWMVKRFSELQGEVVCRSECFSRGGRTWVLKLYPKGNVLGDGKLVSIILLLADCETKKLKEDEKIYAESQIRVLNPSGSNHFTCPFTLMEFNAKSNGWGFNISIEELKMFYLGEEDTLKVEVEFQIVYTINY